MNNIDDFKDKSFNNIILNFSFKERLLIDLCFLWACFILFLRIIRKFIIWFARELFLGDYL